MKPLLLILSSFIFINKGHSQSVGDITINLEIGKKRKITKVEVDGNFPEGDTVWRKGIIRALSTSNFVAKRAKKGKYTVSVVYIVTKDGSIADVKCTKDPGYGLCKEAVRAVIKSPVWKPAPQEGRQVRPFSR